MQRQVCGMRRWATSHVDMIGISVHTSRDLLKWESHGELAFDLAASLQTMTQHVGIGWTYFCSFALAEDPSSTSGDLRGKGMFACLVSPV